MTWGLQESGFDETHERKGFQGDEGKEAVLHMLGEQFCEGAEIVGLHQ